jgi:hypothetical protein
MPIGRRNSRSSSAVKRSANGFALLATAAVLIVASPAPRVWFRGDFESGGLQGWRGDLARAQSAVVVTAPVRRGRYAVRVTLAPGDIAARKERAELMLGDREIERRRGGQGDEIWYGWSLFLPEDDPAPPGDAYPILGQWHHRPPARDRFGRRPIVSGAPPLALYLVADAGQDHLVLIGQSSRRAPPRLLGTRPVRRGVWNDLVFQIRWSTGPDGFVRAWLNGRPWTEGRQYGPTLYTPVSNYLRLGLYRPKRKVRTTNHVFYDEVRLGDSYAAVAPGR